MRYDDNRPIPRRRKSAPPTPPPNTVSHGPVEHTQQEDLRQLSELRQHHLNVVRPRPDAGRGTTSPPPGDKQGSLPMDPAGASARPMLRAPALYQAAKLAGLERMDRQSEASYASAQKAYQDQLKQQHAAAAEIIRRANPEYDPQQASEFDKRHGGTSDVYSKDTTTLLLNSVGYTGNGIKDFNAQVARINDAYRATHGTDPTPGFVLDMIRAPEASDPTALRNLLSGVPQASFKMPVAGLPNQQDFATPEARARFGEARGMEAALRASLYSNDPSALVAAAQAVTSGRRDRDLVQRYVNGDHLAQQQMASMIPGAPALIDHVTSLNDTLRRYGYVPQDFAGRTWQENMRILSAAIGGNLLPDRAGSFNTGKANTTTALSMQDAIKLISDWQTKMNAKYKLGLRVSGVIDDNWAKAITTMSHTSTYAISLLAQEASNAGFGGSFDSFKAFNESGQFANNSDGRAAKDAVQSYLGAQQGMSKFLKDHPFFQQLGMNMGLHFFNGGGWSWSSGLGYIFGGTGGSLNPFNNPLEALANTAGLAEHGVVRGVGSGFSAMNGILQQAKTDFYAGEAIGWNPNDWTGSDYREAAKRLAETDNTWMNILGAGKGFTHRHELLNFATNLVGDILVTKHFGSPGETLKLGSEYATAMRDAMAASDVSLARALVERSNYASERIGQIWKYGQDGRLGQAVASADGMQAGNALGAREWVVDTEGEWAGQFGGYRPLKPGERIEGPAAPPHGDGGSPPPTDGGTPPDTPIEVPAVEPIPATVVRRQSPGEANTLQGRLGLSNRPQEVGSAQELQATATEKPSATVGDEIGRPHGVDWENGASEGTVGPNGATYKRFATPDGREAYMIRQPSIEAQVAGETVSQTANELTVVKRPDGFWQVKEVVTNPRAYRQGWGVKAYEDVALLIQHYGGLGLVRDVHQTVHGLGLWDGLVKRGLPGLAYVEGVGDKVRAAGKAVEDQRLLGSFVSSLGEDSASVAAGREAAKGATAAKLAGIPLEAAGAEQAIAPEVYSWHDLLEQNLIDREAHGNIASWNAIVRHRILDTWRSPTVPARSTKMWQRVQRFGLKGRYPIATPHPLAFVRGRTWEFVSSAMREADHTFEQSNAAGTGFLWHLTRTLRTQFTRAANYRQVPVMAIDPANIRRLALEAGVKTSYADRLEAMFIEARANGDQTGLMYVQNEIAEAAIKQGRDGVANGVRNVFSALVKRDTEHLKYAEATPEQIFGKGGLLETRNWAAISAKTSEMTTKKAALAAHRALKIELRRRGLHPIETAGKYMGEEERSFFVPGMTQQEAQALGKDFGQESVLTPKGVLYTTGDHAGTYSPMGPNGFKRLRGNVADNRSITDFGGGPQAWSADINWDEHIPVDSGFMRSLPFGDLTDATQKEMVTRLLQQATSEEESALYTELLAGAKSEPSPILTEEQMQNFQVPQMGLPKSRGFIGQIGQLNRVPQFFGALTRRLVLTGDPILLEKHGLTDSLRRMIAEGPLLDWQGAKEVARGGNPLRVLRVFNNARYAKALDARLATMPNMKASFDSLYNLMKNSEYRYNIGERGETMPMLFWTGGAKDSWMHAAAAYIDRRLMSGPYQAWKVGGRSAVTKWFMDTEEGQALAAAEGFPGEHSNILATMVSDNLGTIEMADPGFLREAEAIRNGAKEVRPALADYMRKNGINVPVSGHVPADHWFNLMRTLDAGSQKLIGWYLVANKWNRGGLFRDMSGRIYHDLVAIGTPEEDAIVAAMSQAKLITRYHMLDLADALKAEQTFRWAALFFTKHRLYWNWLLQTMRTRPELAVAVHDLADGMDQVTQAHPNQTPGTFSFYLPFNIPGTTPAGGKTLFTIPVARLMWLTESQANPGMLSNLIHSMYSGQSIWPGRGNVGYTTIDSQLNTLYLMTQHMLGNIKTSDGVMASMGNQDRVRFSQIMARVQGGFFAQHHRYMDDHEATEVALHHFFITGIWRSMAFTGSYPEDQRLTSAQDQVWKQYNTTADPRERERLRQANPWIDSMLGVYNTTPRQHVLSAQMWNDFTAIHAGHEVRLDALLADARAHPENVSADLFGAKWRAEGTRYSAEIAALQKKGKSMGASDWLAQFNQDHFAQVHAMLATQLHNMYGLTPAQAEAGRPSWLQSYRDMLYGPNAPLGDAAIAKLPVDQQQIARQTAAVYRSMIRPWNGEPATGADKVRAKFFDTVYSPWVKSRDDWFAKAGREDKQDQGRTYDAMRAWYDSQDHPVTVDGIKFPSPVRVHFAMLPRDAQQQYRRNLMTKQWQWLSGFDKSLLGTKVTKTVQAGWSYFNDTIYQAIAGPAGTIHKAGQHPSISPLQALQYAQYVGSKYPGFLDDYVRGLTPTYQRLSQQHLGATPQARSTWQVYLGRVSQMAEWAAGPVRPDPAYMAQRDQLFNKQLWTDLMETGRAGILNGLPLSRPPDDQYPNGGYLYQLAMAQPDRTFRQEFRQWVTADPDLLYKLFGVGG